MKLLEFFVRNPQRIISRAELTETVWQHTYVDDNAINRAVSELRKYLSHDSLENPLIKTHYRKGYSLTVEPIAPATDSSAEPDHKTATSIVKDAAQSSASKTNLNYKLAIAVLAIVIATLCWLLLSKSSDQAQASNPVVQLPPSSDSFKIEATPATWLIGAENYQSVSPDRALFAYTNFQAQAKGWVQSLTNNVSTPINYKDFEIVTLSWQPKSRLLLTEMVNRERGECFFATFDAVNFPTVTFANIIKSCGKEARGFAQMNLSGTGLYFVDLDALGISNELKYFDILTRDTRTILPSYELPLGVRRFDLSPSAEKILYRRDEQGQPSRYYVYDLQSREHTKLYEVAEYINASDMDWIDEANVIIAQRGQLVRINLDTMSQEFIPIKSNNGFSLISAINHDQLLVSDATSSDYAFSSKNDMFQAEPFLYDFSSDGYNYFPRYIGDELYFVSTRSGQVQYWQKQGNQLKAVTEFSSEEQVILYPLAGTIDGEYLLYRNDKTFEILHKTSGEVSSLSGIDPELINSYEMTEDKTRIFMSYNEDKSIRLIEYDLITDSYKFIENASAGYVLKAPDGEIYHLGKGKLMGLTKPFQLDIPFNINVCLCSIAMTNDSLYVASDRNTINRIKLATGEVSTERYPINIQGIAVSPDNRQFLIAETKPRDTQIMRLNIQKD